MSALATFFRRLFRDTSGAAAIEAVLIMPLAISLMAGGVEFGRVLSAYATADKSIHSAARYLARVPQSAVCSWGLANARNLAVYGLLTPGSASPLITGWTTGTVTLPTCDAALVEPVVIDLRAAVPFSVNMLSAIGISNSFTLNVAHQERHIGE
jgi:Flp pilus assembly protein TadG